MRSLFGMITGFAVVVTTVFHFSKIPEDITAAVVAASYGAFPILAEVQADRVKSKSDRVQAFVTGDYLNPVVASLFVICYLQFIERTIGAIFGAAIGAALTLAGVESQQFQQVILTVAPLCTLLLSSVLIVLIAKSVAYRIKRFPLVWITSAIVVDVLINWVVFLILRSSVPPAAALPPATALLVQAAFEVLLLPGAAVGCWWAKKTQTAYHMSRLFRHLSRSDQEAIIDLVQTSTAVA